MVKSIKIISVTDVQLRRNLLATGVVIGRDSLSLLLLDPLLLQPSLGGIASFPRPGLQTPDGPSSRLRRFRPSPLLFLPQAFDFPRTKKQLKEEDQNI